MILTTLLASAILAPQQKIDFADAWTRTRRAIQTRYYAREARGDEMKALLDKYEPLAKRAVTKAEFSSAVVQMIVEFGDSHFDFLTDADQGFYAIGALIGGDHELDMPHVGAWFVERDGRQVISMVLEGSPAANAGLLPGDSIESVNGSPFHPIKSLMPLVDEEAEFEIILRSGRRKTVTMNVLEDEGMGLFYDATRASKEILEHDEKTFGYIHLWTMAEKRFKTTLHGFINGRARNTDGFILDLRDGFGGRPEEYADPFFRPGINIEMRIGSGGLVTAFGYSKPLVVIIDKGSRSAKEVLAYILKKSGRATLVGERTGGNVLGTSPFWIGDWAVLEIPMIDVIVDGIRLEGVGVEPHVAVIDEFDADGNDLFLARALEILSAQTEAPGLVELRAAG
ncbi:MAG: PDZ domain-containing protein [Armatimonadetes bacterium]|nr:PDZ domain-containing protein [Armatimonadota bacterium]